jgi:hypothetical protein
MNTNFKQSSAYELADQLDNVKYQNGAKPFEMYANMLRQQADRIAELEKEGKVCATCGGLVYDPVIKQTKPLSDEEIMDIAEQSDYSPLEIEMGYDYEIRIARAIEERHGIK